MSENPSILHRLFSLEGKAALITGAGGGIGGVLAVALAEAGAAVGLNDLTLAQLEEPHRMVEEVGGRAVMLPADLASVDACHRLVADACAALGRLDVLVNCAVVNRRKLPSWPSTCAVSSSSARRHTRS
jgi:NAD(P)-dependent dehydrogenase (short-subunit alcohol dehydrogenase family)